MWPRFVSLGNPQATASTGFSYYVHAADAAAAVADVDAVHCAAVAADTAGAVAVSPRSTPQTTTRDAARDARGSAHPAATRAERTPAGGGDAAVHPVGALWLPWKRPTKLPEVLDERPASAGRRKAPVRDDTDAASASSDGGDDADADVDPADVVIDPHARFSAKHIEHRRKLEGIMRGGQRDAYSTKQYDAAASMRQLNPLRRAVHFVKATGRWDASADVQERDDLVPEAERAPAPNTHEPPPASAPHATVRQSKKRAKNKTLARTDSDVEWGSDGPPVASQDEFLSFRNDGEIVMPSGPRMSEHEAILADWLENAMLQDARDTDEDEMDGRSEESVDRGVRRGEEEVYNGGGHDDKEETAREAESGGRVDRGIGAGDQHANSGDQHASSGEQAAGSGAEPVGSGNQTADETTGNQGAIAANPPHASSMVTHATLRMTHGTGHIPTTISDPHGPAVTLDDIAIDAYLDEEARWMSSDGEKEPEEEEDGMVDRDTDEDVAEGESGDDEEMEEEAEVDAGEETADEGDDAEEDSEEQDEELSEDDDEDAILDPDTHAELLGTPFAHPQDASLPHRRQYMAAAPTTQGDALDDPARVPTKKAQRRPPVDDSLWAGELQMQWEHDRARKADKKRARVALRMAAVESANPFPNTHAKPTKYMRKLEKKEHKAQLRMLADVDADVLPAQAAALVQGAVPMHVDSVDGLLATTQAFLEQQEHSTLAFPPMPKNARAIVHSLAAVHGLKSQSHGKGASRRAVLRKKAHSGKHIDHAAIQRLRNAPMDVLGGQLVQRGSLRLRPRAAGADAAPRNREGGQVGGNAQKISEDNIGHQLLRSMGWSLGTGLGHTGGIAEPVTATIKTSRTGLGM
ncbi:squalene synthetase-like protein [Malassezia sp. CBS 17886]|nr:squalene synthetase-like protein [Malassezia sp. CBS 17886]